jgi:hypothetical protein
VEGVPYMPKRVGGAVSGVTKGLGDTVTGVTGGEFSTMISNCEPPC